ncbi:MAG: 30S ribosomal protein S4 [Flavobacteriales bacterium]|nr:30S ribosomal protein S4 [Flavobacteriales bacterium]
MARYIGPKTKISRKLGLSIYKDDKYFEKKSYPPGQHGLMKKRMKKTEYALQLLEKQKIKYMYGILEKQFRNMFKEASRRKGVTGELLLELCELRLDNIVYRLGLSNTRSGARQLVGHKHITVNGKVLNISSYTVKLNDVVALREKSKYLKSVSDSLSANPCKSDFLEWDKNKMEGKLISIPTIEQIKITDINQQLIVELYSK